MTDTIIGPPDRKPDALADGYDWCSCGLHSFPARSTAYVYHVTRGCPSCFPADFTGRIAKPTPAHVVTWMTNDAQRIPREASA